MPRCSALTLFAYLVGVSPTCGEVGYTGTLEVCVLLNAEVGHVNRRATGEFRLETPSWGLEIPDPVCTKADVALVLDVTNRCSLQDGMYLIGSAVPARTVQVRDSR